MVAGEACVSSGLHLTRCIPPSGRTASDPLEKACDSPMLANLRAAARAASLRFYAGFLNRPAGAGALRPGAGGPQSLPDVRSHGARRGRPGVCVSAPWTAAWEHRPARSRQAVGVCGAPGQLAPFTCTTSSTYGRRGGVGARLRATIVIVRYAMTCGFRAQGRRAALPGRDALADFVLSRPPDNASSSSAHHDGHRRRAARRSRGRSQPLAVPRSGAPCSVAKNSLIFCASNWRQGATQRSLCWLFPAPWPPAICQTPCKSRC
jgi:hypothetical protein